MKKATLSTVYAILTDSIVDDKARNEALADVAEEINLAEARRRAKTLIYDDAHDAVMDAIRDYGPITAKELFSQIEKEVSEEFTMNKLQYGLNHIWKDELTIDSTASPHTYSL